MRSLLAGVSFIIAILSPFTQVNEHSSASGVFANSATLGITYGDFDHTNFGYAVHLPSGMVIADSAPRV
jgi:hypothetical protein